MSLALDGDGGTANAAGAVVRGNLGINLINGSTAAVTNRSRHTLLQCDVGGDCK